MRWAPAAVLLVATCSLAGCAQLNAEARSGPPLLAIAGSSSFAPFDGHVVELFDFDGDGVQEIVAQNDDRRVYVLDSRDGSVRAALETTHPPSWRGGGNAGDHKVSPAAATLAEGEPPALVVFNSAAVLTLFRYDGTEFVRQWERRMDDCHEAPTSDARPVLADVDGDGVLDILVQTEEVGAFAVQADGEILWGRCISGGNGEPAAADLDGDGALEVVLASDAGVVTAVKGARGEVLWRFHARAHAPLGSASIPVGVTVAQVDGEGPLDIVFGARDSHDPVDWSVNHAALFVLRGDGSVLWMRQDPAMAPLTYTHPIVVDEDGDGRADVFWADWNNIGHKPPWDEAEAWKRTGPVHVVRYTASGDLVWRQAVEVPDGDMDLALADVDGDGVQEVLVAGQHLGSHGVWALDARTGDFETFTATHPWAPNRGVTVGDLWGTGTSQLVVPVQDSGEGAILVYDTQAPHDALWPHAPGPRGQAA